MGDGGWGMEDGRWGMRGGRRSTFHVNSSVQLICNRGVFSYSIIDSIPIYLYPAVSGPSSPPVAAAMGKSARTKKPSKKTAAAASHMKLKIKDNSTASSSVSRACTGTCTGICKRNKMTFVTTNRYRASLFFHSFENVPDSFDRHLRTNILHLV